MSVIKVEGLRDRQNEVWRPLLAIATLASDDWPTRARRAAVALAAGDASDEPSLGLLLLTDIQAVFAQRVAERIATADLIVALGRIDESPWGGWWLDKDGFPNRTGPRRLAQLLRPHSIRVRAVRIGDRTPKGYRREDFSDAWERFLIGHARPGATGATSATSQPQSQANVADVADVADGREGLDGDGDPGEWLARDGRWRSIETDPPAFPGEVVATHAASVRIHPPQRQGSEGATT